MQRVDPFIPVSSVPKNPLPNRLAQPTSMPWPQPVPQPTPAPAPRFVSPREATLPPQGVVRSNFNPPHTKIAKPQPTSKPRSRFKTIMSTLWQAMFLLGALSLGFVARSVIVGQIAVLAYAVLALVYRIESRTTFILGVMAFGVVLISSLRGDTVLATAFAVYAFLLLIVGTVSLAREIRDDI